MKEFVKSLIGIKGIEFIRWLLMWKKIIFCYIYGSKGKLILHDDVRLLKVLSIKGKNVFFGYYDLQQMNEKQDKLLIHVVEKNANTKRDPILIGYYNIEKEQYVMLAESRAWAWQQGCRLRWNPRNQEEILFNDLCDNHYVCKILNICSRQITKIIPIALYDVDNNLKYGLGLNFSRLQRLRPGYGYGSLPDKSESQNIPLHDGIYRYDFHDEQVKLIVSYERLCSNLSCDLSDHHYINHISISPNGDKFLFFHVRTKGNGMKWYVRLCVSDMEGDNIMVLEEEDIISHYTWKNNDIILTTKLNFGNNDSCYCEYNVISGEKRIINSDNLKCDGHPTFLNKGDVFITDTYPQSDSLQHVYLYDKKNVTLIPLVDIFHNPKFYQEKRCDLHPRLTIDNEFFTIDSTYKDSLRSVLLFKLNKRK